MIVKIMFHVICIFSLLTASSVAAADSTCFVTRISALHAGRGGQRGSFEILLESLENQTVGYEWTAVVAYLDVMPFPGDLRGVLKSYEPRDISLFAEWIVPDLSQGGDFSYQQKLFALTDEAIRACPSDSTWVIATDGDMTYDKHFLYQLHKSGSGVDIVAFDYYAKYQRLTADPCERFSLPLPLKKGASRCVENTLGPCSIDLGATAFRQRRLVDEGRRFQNSVYRGDDKDIKWEEYDGQFNAGILANQLVDDGWLHTRVLGGNCLVGKAETPQTCAAMCKDGGWGWDDVFMSRSGYLGGNCKPMRDIMINLGSSKGRHLELLSISLSYDPASFDFGAGNASCFEKFQCMRLKDKSRWANKQVFGKICQARSDQQQPWAKDLSHPFDAYINERLDNKTKKKNEL